jgi:hypothetical protein
VAECGLRAADCAGQSAKAFANHYDPRFLVKPLITFTATGFMFLIHLSTSQVKFLLPRKPDKPWSLKQNSKWPKSVIHRKEVTC